MTRSEERFLAGSIPALRLYHRYGENRSPDGISGHNWRIAMTLYELLAEWVLEEELALVDVCASDPEYYDEEVER